jgi:hypothetical protein
MAVRTANISAARGTLFVYPINICVSNLYLAVADAIRTVNIALFC